MSKTDNRRFVCLCALVIVGDALLGLKFSKNTTNDIIGVLAAFVLSAAVVLITKKGTELWELKEFKYKRSLSVTIMLGFCLLLVTSAVFTVYNFSEYAANIMLSTGELLIPFVTFGVLAVVVAFSDKNVLMKLSLLLFPAAAVFIVVMFGFSAQFMNVKYLIPYKEADGAGFLSSFLPLFLNLTVSVAPLLVIGKNNKKRYFACGYLFGIGLLALCVINTLALFGGELASTLSYPYSEAVSTASMGEIFSRLDGFLYTTCFFTGIIKTSACVFSAISLLKRIVQKIL